MDKEIEMWRDVVGYEGLYLINKFGYIFSLKGNKILSFDLNKSGYYHIKLYKNGTKKTLKVHRLVGDAFIQKVNNKNCIDHIDSDRLNNFYKNLRWCTQSEKHQFAIDNGKINLPENVGVNHPLAKLTESDVRQIRILLKDKSKKPKYIASIYGVSDRNIFNIKYGKIWRHVS